MRCSRRESIPQGLKPRLVNDGKRPKAEALRYREASAGTIRNTGVLPLRQAQGSRWRPLFEMRNNGKREICRDTEEGDDAC